MRRIDRVTAAVVAVMLLGTAVRFVGLGARPFHWEEARVGYWTLRYAETGSFSYRPVGGGPLLYHATEAAFSVVPVTDATARAFPALLGGALAGGALLFRGRLRDDETVALAVVLAFSPLLLYYSRFLRGDLPAAAFAFLAIGFAVRAVDAGAERWLYGAGVAAGLALSSSMQTLGYAVVLAVGLAAALDHRRVRDAAPLSADRAASLRGFLSRWLGPFAGSAVAFAATMVLAYAPRGSDLGPLALFEAGLLGPFESATGVYALGREGPAFLDALSFAGGSLAVLGFPVLVAAAVGFLSERYGRGRPRLLVQWSGFAAGFGFLLFPLANEVLAPWVLVHVSVLLAIPAAVGLALVARYARTSLADGDGARLAAALLVLLALGVPTAALATDAYATPADPAVDSPGDEGADRFAQFAQPADDLEPLVGLTREATAEGGDVVYVGQRYYLPDDRALEAPPLSEAQAVTFGARLPLSWYLERAGVTPKSVATPENLGLPGAGEEGNATPGEDGPALVLAQPEHGDAVATRLEGYEQRRYRTALENREVVVFVREPA
ncbi:MAG: flippase activity-associated protein Agl23 [Haloferacaceae archaeon]